MKLIKAKFHIVAILKTVVYKLLFGKRIYIGKKTTFRKNFRVCLDADGKIDIGDNCFFNNGCSINALGRVFIGSGSIFGEDIKIYDHNHRFNKAGIPLKEQGFSVGEVYIGPDCWIGSNVVILKGAKIGNNCVIGAGCVIDCEIPPYSIVTATRELKITEIQFKANDKI